MRRGCCDPRATEGRVRFIVRACISRLEKKVTEGGKLIKERTRDSTKDR